MASKLEMERWMVLELREDLTKGSPEDVSIPHHLMTMHKPAHQQHHK